MLFVELGDRSFQGEFSAGDLETLNKVRGPRKQYPPSVFHERQTKSRCCVALA